MFFCFVRSWLRIFLHKKRENEPYGLDRKKSFCSWERFGKGSFVCSGWQLEFVLRLTECVRVSGGVNTCEGWPDLDSTRVTSSHLDRFRELSSLMLLLSREISIWLLRQMCLLLVWRGDLGTDPSWSAPRSRADINAGRYSFVGDEAQILIPSSTVSSQVGMTWGNQVPQFLQRAQGCARFQRRRIEICRKIVKSMLSNCSEMLVLGNVLDDPMFYGQWINLPRSITKWTKSCGKRLYRLIIYIHYTSEYKQYCHAGNTAKKNSFKTPTL